MLKGSFTMHKSHKSQDSDCVDFACENRYVVSVKALPEEAVNRMIIEPEQSEQGYCIRC